MNFRRYLARRRWHRWYNAIRAMNRMKKTLNVIDEEAADTNGTDGTNGRPVGGGMRVPAGFLVQRARPAGLDAKYFIFQDPPWLKNDK